MPRISSMIRYNLSHPPKSIRPGYTDSAWRDPITGDYVLDKVSYMGIPSKRIAVDLTIEAKVFSAIVKTIDTPEKWCKGALARLGNGRTWHKVSDPIVVSRCIVGAMDYIKEKNMVAIGPHADRIYNKLSAFAREMKFHCLEDFNDHFQVRHEHMMKFLNKAGIKLGYIAAP